MTKFIFVICLVSITICQNNGAKILGIFPIPAPSHYILGNNLLRGLAERGHDVTMISAFVESNPPKNGSYRDVLIQGLAEKHNEKRKQMNIFETAERGILLFLPFMLNMGLELTEYMLADSNVQALLNSNEHFDLVIVEQFNNDAHKGFAQHFKAPLISFSTIGANNWVNQLSGNPAPPSYVPDLFLSYSTKMTFMERTVNTLFSSLMQGINAFYMYPKQGQIYRKYFPNGPDWSEVLYNSSLFLLNSHPSTNNPVPFVPSMVDIGGFHVNPPKKLPQDLQDFLDKSTNGVIYFSMGSNLRSVDLPQAKRDALLKAFSKLKQNVLWKFEADDLPGRPGNVKLGKWLPQQDILAHPNVQLFITHGGLLSTTETIYHGVQVLAIPIAGDQKLNAQMIVNQGFGLQLTYKDLSNDEVITKAINTLLTDTRFANNAKMRSKLFHDRIAKPMDSASYWIEYVIRHGGAPHLKVAAEQIPYYQYLLLDVFGFLAIIAGILLYVSCKVVTIMYSKLCKKQKIKMN